MKISKMGDEHNRGLTNTVSTVRMWLQPDEQEVQYSNPSN